MTFAMRTAQAWMKASSFADARAERDKQYEELKERWKGKSLRFENQGLLVLEMVEKDSKLVIGEQKAA